MSRPLIAIELEPRTAIEAVTAAWVEGAAVAPLPSVQPRAERAAWLDALQPTAVIEADGRRTDRPGGAAVADDTDLVVATSGSTGVPKGVELGRTALEASVDASLARLGAHDGDVWACCLPVHHVAGLAVLWRAHRSGARVVHLTDADALPGTDATRVSLVPTQLARLLSTGADLRRLSTVLLGGAAAPANLLDTARHAGVPVVTTYGMTETCGGCVYDGAVLDGAEVAVDDDGRLRIRGPMVAQRYRLRPDLDVAFTGGWFTTGDLGRVDGDRVEVLGRADDLIVTGGENVAPSAVEALLTQHPGVAEVAVTAAPDREWGQAVVAVVVPVEAGSPPTLDELRDHVKARASAPHAPRRLIVVDALPRAGLGKIDRTALAGIARHRDARP